MFNFRKFKLFSTELQTATLTFSQLVQEDRLKLLEDMYHHEDNVLKERGMM